MVTHLFNHGLCCFNFSDLAILNFANSSAAYFLGHACIVQKLTISGMDEQ